MSRSKLLIISLVLFLLIAGTVVGYLLFINYYPVTGQNNAYYFSSVFSGILTPFLTILSVGTAVWVFLSQRSQFVKQQNLTLTCSLIDRFDKQFDKYLELINKPFPAHPNHGRSQAFCIADFHTYKDTENRKIAAKSTLEFLKKIDFKADEQSDYEFRVADYMRELDIDCRVCLAIVSAAVSIESEYTAPLLTQLKIRSSVIISVMQQWRLIDKEESVELKRSIGWPVDND